MRAKRKDPSDAARPANALERIEQELQRAFSGDDGTRRLASLQAALGRHDPISHLKDPWAQAAYIAAAIIELERLHERAQSEGIAISDWETALESDGDEQHIPFADIDALVARIGVFPAEAIRAQARITRNMVRSLTG